MDANQTSTQLLPPTHPLRRTDLTSHELDGEVLIFDPISMDTHRLNSVALFIWRLCDGTNDAQRVARRMTEVYDVTMETAVEHVERICDQLHSMGLFVATGGDAPRSLESCS